MPTLGYALEHMHCAKAIDPACEMLNLMSVTPKISLTFLACPHNRTNGAAKNNKKKQRNNQTTPQKRQQQPNQKQSALCTFFNHHQPPPPTTTTTPTHSPPVVRITSMSFNGADASTHKFTAPSSCRLDKALITASFAAHLPANACAGSGDSSAYLPRHENRKRQY